MTRVDVCGMCGTLFEEGQAHCRRCGAERASSAVTREMRELCPTCKGEETAREDAGKDVRPIFEPAWGDAQWYETEDGRPGRGRRKGRGQGEGTDEGGGKGRA